MIYGKKITKTYVKRFKQRFSIFSRNMIYYIVCPYFETGGPEAMHQLCHELNTLGKEAYVVYLNRPDDAKKPILYAETYSNIKNTTTIQDIKDNILIFPEIYTSEWICKYIKVQNIRMAVWWLSLNNAVSFDSLPGNVKDKNIIHLFQSHYVKDAILKNLGENTSQTWFDLHDYTRELFTNAYATKAFNNKFERGNMIAYNPTKDFISSKLIQQWDLRSLPLVDLSPTIMMYKLHECKIYVDLGAHPGKDRIPREAAMCGCVVVTNLFGSAANDIDVPIDEKVDGPDDLNAFIKCIFEDYATYYEKQKSYRDWILNEKNRFIEQIKALDAYFTEGC